MPPSGTAMATTNTVPRTTRADYHKEALQHIRASLQPFANGGPTRERLSPVRGFVFPPPTPARASHHHHHHQPPSPHHHYHHLNGGTVTPTTSTSSRPSSTSSSRPPSTASIDFNPPPPLSAKHYGYEPPPPAPPPRVPLSASSPPTITPSQMPPILSRLSPSPAKGKTPNYVNVSAGVVAPGRPMVVPHTAVPPPVMGPPPPYPTHAKPPLKNQPPPYTSRLSPSVDRTSPSPSTHPPSPSSGGSSFGQISRQAKTPNPVIMQSVRSTHVQKPVLQTAVAPPSPPPSTSVTPTLPPPYSSSSVCSSPYTLPPTSSPYTLPPTSSPYTLSPSPYTLSSPSPQNITTPVPQDSPVPMFDPPSYHSTMQAKAAAAQTAKGVPLSSIPVQDTPLQDLDLSSTPLAHIPIEESVGYECEPTSLPRRVVMSRSASPVSSMTSHDTHTLSPSPVSCLSTSSPSTQSDVTMESGYVSSTQSQVRGIMAPPPPITTSMPPPGPHKTLHHSPIPPRKKNPEVEGGNQRQTSVEPRSKCTPEAYKFYMEQHVENVIKSAEQRKNRGLQLEREMKKIGLSEGAQDQMRKVLSQKESNFNRLKRAKMNKSMFTIIKTIGVGAFGEVSLVRKDDCSQLYAMKTLRKKEILMRNQIAHVKAERDILAESDNDWVVKLYYSFQDNDSLYLIMDYIPGGDLMSLLIKFGIFREPLARFYIAELVCAIESVHKMGFIHRDIKPDNILIDRDGHIKLTDFGLCTGFRWTHNSRYYQKKGDHSRQESMDVCRENDIICRCHDMKPLERRKKRQHMRCQAHSLVGTPNYIAPEVLARSGYHSDTLLPQVLARSGYTELCDWWSVGVILYEMLVGQPPFLANSPAETQLKVLNWQNHLRIPHQSVLSDDARDLMLRLLTSPENRLGRNAQEIKSHPFFKEVDFDAGLRKQKALYIPEINHPMDTSNFDPIETDRLRSDGETEDWTNTSHPYHGFYEFTFRRFFHNTHSTPLGPETSSTGGTDDVSKSSDSTEEKEGVSQDPVYV